MWRNNTAWKVSKYGVFSGPHFLAFGLNTERYSAFLRIQSECGKIRTRKNSAFGHFSRSVSNIEHFKVIALRWRNSLHKKWSFTLRISLVNPQFPADLFTLTEEILNGKLHFLWNDCSYEYKRVHALADWKKWEKMAHKVCKGKFFNESFLISKEKKAATGASASNNTDENTTIEETTSIHSIRKSSRKSTQYKSSLDDRNCVICNEIKYEKWSVIA